jgi:hypothetical protein
MAKSRTRKKSNRSNLPPESRIITDLATSYLKYWTNRELGIMQREERNPICLPTNNGYKIGLYTLNINKNRTCEVFDPNHQSVHTFDDKISAILYVIYTIKNRFNTAWEILALDKEINKNYADMQAMQRSQQQARVKKDYEIVDIRQARLEIAEKQLEIARSKILKIQTHAKYNKVWLT